MRREFIPAVLGFIFLFSFTLACEPAKLAGLPAAGPSAIEITVTTTPSGAGVVIDGTPVGPAPVTVKLNPGPHRLKAAKSGFFGAEQKLVVSSSDAARAVSLTLVSSH